MGATVTTANTNENTWGGGNEPMGASYGKLMMWFFIVSDALTFSGFLAAYGFSRFKFIDNWPIADEVFTHFPFMHGVDAPMYYVALMTFILIFSSVTPGAAWSRVVEYSYVDARSGYAGVTRFVRSSGAARMDQDTLVIESASSVLLLTRIEHFPDFSAARVEALRQAVEQITPDYAALLERQIGRASCRERV